MDRDGSNVYYKEPLRKIRSKRQANAEGYIPTPSTLPTLQPLSDYEVKDLIYSYQSLMEDEVKMFAPRAKPEPLDSKPSDLGSYSSSSGGGWQSIEPSKPMKKERQQMKIVGPCIDIHILPH